MLTRLFICRKRLGLELEVGPLEYEYCHQNCDIDKKGNSTLVMQLLHFSIPEKDIDHCRKCSRTHDHWTPPYLPREYSDATRHETDSGQDARKAGQPSCCVIAKQLCEEPRPIGPDHASLKLEEPPALAKVQQMNQAMQHHKYTDDELQQGIPPLSWLVGPSFAPEVSLALIVSQKLSASGGYYLSLLAVHQSWCIQLYNKAPPLGPTL